METPSVSLEIRLLDEFSPEQTIEPGVVVFFWLLLFSVVLLLSTCRCFHLSNQLLHGESLLLYPCFARLHVETVHNQV